MMKKVLAIFFCIWSQAQAQQTFLFPDTLRNKNTPLLTDSSDKLPNTMWVKQQQFLTGSSGTFILNRLRPAQTANYFVTNAYNRTDTGFMVGNLNNNYTWSTLPNPVSGTVFGTGATVATFNLNTGGGITANINNGALLSSSFHRLVLNSTAATGSITEMNGNGTIPRAFSALSTQVYLPGFSATDTVKVSDVASMVIKSVYRDPGATNSVKAINYYQLLIEPSNEYVTDASTLLNLYGIYQVGTADTNFLNGPLKYSNKIATSKTPVAVPGTGAGTSATMTVSGTTDGGVLTLTTGTSPTTGATIATLTFTGFTFPNGCSVVLYPANGAAAALTGAQAVYATGAKTGWTVNAGSTALAASTQYIWNYQISGY